MDVSVTDKISITIGRNELRHARKHASLMGLSLSTFISEAVRERVAERERREAAMAVLASFAPEERATAEERAELLDRWGETQRAEAPAKEARAPRPPRKTRARARSGAAAQGSRR
jgi:hypothetical protein